LLLGGCVGPARTSEAYLRKASTSVDDVRSAVETARLAVDAAAGDRATEAYLSILLREAEGQATSVQTSFASIQPPNEDADRLREQVDGLLSDAVSLLADLRIGARRGDKAALTGRAPELEALSQRLSDFEESLR
jgi:hypothetical protein